jgi:1-acyl-sn-glycerol-3-phosphate acyltransferase
MYSNVNLFPEDSYDTPPDKKRDTLARLSFNSRFYFFLRTIAVFYGVARSAHHGQLDRERQISHSNKNIHTLEGHGARIHLRNLNKIDAAGGPYVVIGNHMSAIETTVLNAIIGPRLNFTFIFKRSLLKLPYMGAALKALDAIPVDRVNPRDDFKTILTEGTKKLAAGRSILVFPQSTRSVQFIPEEFNTIGVKLARSAGVKVLPLALKTDFLASGKIFNDFGPIHPNRHIHFEFGDPIEVTGNGREAHQQVIDFITERLSAWNTPESTR